MKFVCANSVYQGREAFSTIGDALVLADHAINASDVSCADGLVVRSKTVVNERLLGGSCVRFVGTATAGFDHFDQDYLGGRNGMTVSAPGCNANSVAEYVVSSLLFLADKYHMRLSDMTLGVIGVGCVGTLVAEKCSALGVHIMLNDPPRYDATRDPVFQPLQDLLTHANILSFHVPLTDKGPYSTYGMADCRFFAAMKQGTVFINASRGEVVNAEALKMALDRGHVTRCVLDVWENEPDIDVELMSEVDLATPHIAGYSLDGKLKGTEMVYRQACNYFEVEPVWTPSELPAPSEPKIKVDCRGLTHEEVLWHVVRRAYDVTKDDERLRAGISTDHASSSAHFVQQRSSYPARREFAAYTVELDYASDELLAKVRGLGFGVQDSGFRSQ